MSALKVGIIGYGSIGHALSGLISADPALADVALTILVREGRETPHPTVHSVADLLDARPDLIVEAAGHGAVAALIPDFLAAGIDCVVASIGALADYALHQRLETAATDGGARMILPAGAIGGIDLLSALRPSGISQVIYEGRKPPAAWKGSAAESALELDTLTEAATFFEGSAREAALRYPKNANVAATLALAGIGFDKTQARLIADPTAPGNLHSYRVYAGGSDYRIEIAGKPSPDNPRTSMTTVYSLLREIVNRANPVAI